MRKLCTAVVCLLAMMVLVPAGMLASSHREAPITALDHPADITDIYAFRSYDANGKDTNPPSITMIKTSPEAVQYMASGEMKVLKIA